MLNNAFAIEKKETVNDQRVVAKRKALHLEGIRGFACLMVILSHLVYEYVPHWHANFKFPIKTSIDDFMGNAPLGFIYSGNTAVSIFFVLSGMVLTKVIFNSKTPYRSLTASVIKRYWRLAFPATVSCVIIYIVSMMATFIGYHPQVNNATLLAAIKSGAIDSFFNKDPLYNVVLWTMRIEFLGSLLIFFACACMLNTERKNLVLVFFSGLTILSITQSSDMYYLLFLLGSAIELNKPKFGFISFISLIVPAIYLSGHHYHSSSYETLNTVVISINKVQIENAQIYNGIAGLMIVLAICGFRKAELFFSSPAMVFLGKMSFSAYLIHIVVLYYMNTIFIEKFQSYSVGAITLSLSSVIFVYLLSIPFEKYIDRFSIKLSNKVGAFFINKGA